MRRLAIGLTLGAVVGLWLSWHGETLAQTFGLGNFKRITTQRVTQTVADNGAGTAASFTVTTAEVGYVEVDCLDSNGCTGTLSESGAREGQDLMVCQVSASPGLVTFNDSSGVTELLNGTSYVMAQWECLSLRYAGDRWMEWSRTQFSGAITASDVATFTNKTYDAAGSGNVFTSTYTEWIPAARCDNATATSPDWSFPTSNPAVPACVTGSNTQFGVLDFADGANALSAQFHRMLPADWSGTIGLKFKWLTSATSGAVVWQAATIAVADAETTDPAFNTASTVTDTAKGTTLQTNDASIASVTITGAAAGELLFWKITRDPTHASDTLAATARLLGVEITMTRAQ